MSLLKLKRRHSKYRQILKNDYAIDTSEDGTKILMVGNAGLVSGVSCEQLAQVFTQYGRVERIVMIPNKSYSFISFSAVGQAIKAYDAINGRVKIENMDGPMYLVFAKAVPSESFYLTSSAMPDGLTLLRNFVSCGEEEMLLKCVEWDSDSSVCGRDLKHRRVKHFGYEFRYDINNVDKDSPLTESIPDECTFIYLRLKEQGYPLPWVPDQLTINQYQKGQGIPSHIDTHSAFESPLLSLSLGSDIVMEFKRGTSHFPMLLPRRSLLIMDKEARYAWTHGITPRTMDVVQVEEGLSVQERGCRTSFTFRKVCRNPCNCAYPAHCDSQQEPATIDMLPYHLASQLEQLHVHQVYDNIADHFNETRTKIWPNVLEFLQCFPSGSLIIDAGCGNGKYFGLNPNTFQLGFDRCLGLAEITSQRGNEVFVSDCLNLPLKDELADGLISVAVLHHLSTRERRLQALKEMSRVLVSGGLALVTVWAKEQMKENKTAYLKQDRKNRKNHSVPCGSKEAETFHERSFKNPNTIGLDENIKLNEMQKPNEDSLLCKVTDFKLPIHLARTEFKHQDLFVPWKVKSNPSVEKPTFLRYYHVFKENELYILCKDLPKINILKTYYTEGNWCIVFKKV